MSCKCKNVKIILKRDDEEMQGHLTKTCGAVHLFQHLLDDFVAQGRGPLQVAL